MFYEIRKFYKTPAIILLSMVAIIVSMVMPIFFIYDYESYDYIEEDEVVVKGIEAIERRKEQVKKTSGIIRTEVLNEALRLYKSETSFDKAYIRVEKNYPELYQLLRVAYAPYLGDNIFEVKSISSADDYYNKNVDKIRSKIAFYGATTITREEAQEAIHRGATIQKPYNYEFVEQWAIMMKALIFTYAVIVLLAIVIANQLFSFEKEKNMAMILHTFNLGFVRVLQSTMLAIVAGFLLIIGGLLSGFCFSKRLTK